MKVEFGKWLAKFTPKAPKLIRNYTFDPNFGELRNNDQVLILRLGNDLRSHNKLKLRVWSHSELERGQNVKISVKSRRDRKRQNQRKRVRKYLRFRAKVSSIVSRMMARLVFEYQARIKSWFLEKD